MSSVFLVHFSDPHIGSTTRGGGWLWQTTGHDLRILEAFSNALGRIRRWQSDARILVHSGDASATGAQAQLDLYTSLRDVGVKLHGPAARGLVRLPAFSAGFNEVVDIPGNHDLWNGIVLNPSLNPAAKTDYWQGSWTARVQLPNLELALHGICSTSGSSPRQQLCAVGEYIDADLADLEHRITSLPVNSRRINVVVTHHSPAVGTAIMHGLSSRSRTALQQLCARCNVDVLLTGHAHTYDIVDSADLPVEIRASTVMQYNLWPQTQPRQFWLHSIEADQLSTRWIATPWRYENRRFTELTGQRQSLVFS